MYILSFKQDFIFYKEYFTNNTIFYKEKSYDYNWFLKDYTFHGKPKMKPTQVMSRNNDVVTNMDITDLIGDDNFNLSDFNLSDVDSDNGSDNGRPSLGDLYTVGSLVEPLGEQPKKKATTKKKRTSKKRPKTERQPKRPKPSINWNYLSKNYDTLFYPIFDGQVVPQVMTIAGVKQKDTNRTSAKGPKIVYIFKVKHNNNNIDEEINRWSKWRRDYNSVNSWVQQIGHMIKNCENDSQRNFLKALRRSFTITKRTLRKNKDKNDLFKQEMAVCYVHFIKDRRTNDHTWGKFQQYMDESENCRALKIIYDKIKDAKAEQNKKDPKKKDKPYDGTGKFASNAFHDSLEYVNDETFNVSNNTEEEQAKQQLAIMFDIDTTKPTFEGMGKAVTLLMAKLKF